MKELLNDLTGHDVTRAKVILASVVVVLALYQVFLQAVGYGRIRLPFLAPGAASQAHRAVGDTVLLLAAVLAFMCLVNFKTTDAIRNAASGDKWRIAGHGVAGIRLLVALFLKVMVVRVWRRFDRALPYIGVGVLALFLAIWALSALDYLVTS